MTRKLNRNFDYVILS